MKKVAVIMGSDSDFPVVSGAIKTLKEYGVSFEVHVMSAHRTPSQAAEFSSTARSRGFGVIIAAAGIGIPIKSSTLDGLDALLATVQMPKGIPVATVAIDGADNAALLAVQILALSDDTLAEKLDRLKADMEAGVLKKDEAIQSKVAEL